MELVAARATKPGSLISRELDERGWSQKDLADIMGRPLQAVNEIVNGNKQITPETAFELAEAFDTSAELWMGLEAAYRLYLAKQKVKTKGISLRSKLFALTPLKEIIKRRWVEGSDSLETLEENLRKFWEIKTVDSMPLEIASRRHSVVKTPEILAQIAVIKRAKMLAKKKKVSKFNLEVFKEGIADVLGCAKDLSGVKQVQKKLAKLGVYLVVVPRLPQSFLDGAVFYLKDNPVIVLTLRYDRVDNFWFTLMHEIAHIALEDKGTHLDDDITKYSGLDIEKRADGMAQNWLIPTEQYEKFVKTFSVLKSKSMLQDFAKRVERHPGIILGRLQHDKILDFYNFRSMLQKVSPELGPIIDK